MPLLFYSIARCSRALRPTPTPHAPAFPLQLDPFAAVAKVGFEGNAQIFLAIAAIELANFNKHYGEGTEGDIGWDFLGLLDGKTEAEKRRTMEQEIVHCR